MADTPNPEPALTKECDYFVGKLTAKSFLTQAEATFYQLDDIFSALREGNYIKNVKGAHVSLEKRYVEILFDNEQLHKLISNGLRFKGRNNATLNFEKDALPLTTVTVVDVPLELPNSAINAVLHEYRTIVEEFIVQ